MWKVRVLWFMALLSFLFLTVGCANVTRHQVVQADYAFATAVGLVDDALFSACQTHAIPADTCNEQIKPRMITVDTSVKIASQTLRNLPSNAQMPKSVPDLLASLHAIQGVLDSLGDLTNPMVSRAATLLQRAVDSATQILYAFSAVESR